MKIPHVDVFGQTIQVGDLVMTKSLDSTINNYFAIVKRITPKAIIVDIEKQWYAWGDYDPVTKSYPNKTLMSKIREMRRNPHECIKITPAMHQQFLANAATTRQAILSSSLEPNTKVTTLNKYHTAIDEYSTLIQYTSPFYDDEEVNAAVEASKKSFIHSYPEYQI